MTVQVAFLPVSMGLNTRTEPLVLFPVDQRNYFILLWKSVECTFRKYQISVQANLKYTT